MSVRRNTLINLVGSIMPMAVMLVTVPLYLKQLGEARYGVLALVWLVLGYFSFLEMGLGKATANQIAKTHETSIVERSEIFWTALLINSAMGLLGASILWLIGDYLISNVLKMPEDFRQETIKALPWMIATLPLALVSSVLNGALEGRNRFLTVNILQVVSNSVFQIAPLVIAYIYGPSLAIVIPAAVLARVTMNIPFVIACYRAVPFTLIPHFSIERAKLLFSYGGWVALTGIVSPIMETADRFLIGVVSGANAVAHYTIAYQLATKVRVLPASLSRALFPRFSGDQISAKGLAVDAFSGLVAIMTLVIVLGILLVKPFLNLWVGADVSEHAAPITQIILVGVWANSLAYIPLVLLQGGGRPSWVAKLHLTELLPFLAILYLATSSLGVLGAAAAWALRVIVDAFLLYYAAGILKNVVKKSLIPFVMVLTALFITLFLNDFWILLVSCLALLAWLIGWFCKTPTASYIKTSWNQRIATNAK